MRRLAGLFLVLGLAACAPGQPGGTVTSRDAGLAGVYSRQVVISDHPHHVLLGHVIRATQDGQDLRALVISHQWDGVHRIRLRSAWRDGTRLPFRPLPRDGGCTRSTCRNGALGFIALSPRMLDRATAEGFRASLVTSVGTIEVAAPAAIFAEIEATR